MACLFDIIIRIHPPKALIVTRPMLEGEYGSVVGVSKPREEKCDPCARACVCVRARAIYSFDL